jgi:thiol-disulfide isomerase/thioredoxin
MTRAFAVGAFLVPAALAGSLPGISPSTQSNPSGAEPLVGTIKLPDGAPAAGVTVYLCRKSESGGGAWFTEGTLGGGDVPNSHADQTTSDSEGRFRFAGPTETFAIAVIHDRGYAEASEAQFRQDPVLTLKPWARVEGVLRRGRAPRPNNELRLEVRARGYDSPQVVHVYKTRTDDQGRFAIERVPYGQGDLGPLCTGARRIEYYQPLHIEPGGTTHAVLGGRGRPIVGRIAGPPGVDVDLGSEYQSVDARKKSPDVPDEVLEQGKEAIQAWWEGWRATDEGRHWDALPSFFSSKPDVEGAFRLEELPAGSWILLVDLQGPVTESKDRRIVRLGRLAHNFIVPEMLDEQSDEPLDLGTLTADPVPIPLQIGDEAPAFEATTLDGRTVKLTELRGKIVLLDFWATWCGPCLQQMPKLKAVYDKFGQHERFIMLGISLDRKREKLVEYVRANDVRWPQVFLEDGTKAPLAVAYRVEGIPTVVLVGPDGKVLAFQPPPGELPDLVARALAAP